MKRLGIIFTLIFLASCGVISESSPGGDKSEEDYAIPVKVTKSYRGDISYCISAVGTIFPWVEAKLSAKIPGKIERIMVQEGSRVNKGDLLIQLEDREYVIALEQAKAQLELAEARLINARGDWQRAQQLFQQKVISPQEYDRLKSLYDIALAQWKTSQSQQRMAETQLENTRIKAPFAGTIVQKYVNEAEQITPGLPLLYLMDISRVKSEVEVSEIYRGNIRLGQEALVLVDSYPGKTFAGKVVQIRPLVDPQSRTFKVTIAIPNQDNILNAGMFSRVKIQIAHHPNALLVPRSAIVETGGKEVIYKVTDSIAHMIEVETGYEQDGKIEVIAGIEEGDLVVTEGNYGLAHGARVFISQPESK
jgi:RND family efflux transporter MFP subunit